MTESSERHWSDVYATKSANDVSWYQSSPALSLSLIQKAAPDPVAGILDVGGGASVLVDQLLSLGYRDLSVLDIAASALAHSRGRLGDRRAEVDWIVCDITRFEPARKYALWHDRACFHFLTDEADRGRYVTALKAALAPGGSAIIASFATDGPEKCSGLSIQQYDAERIQSVLGPAFLLREEPGELHSTPWNSTQSFVYFQFEYRP